MLAVRKPMPLLLTLFAFVGAQIGSCPNGYNVTTLAGQPAYGYTDGVGISAQFKFPGGSAIDKSGNVFVADYSNHVIRKVSPNGNVTTYVGSGVLGWADGQGLTAKFDSPNDIVIDQIGNMYLVEWNGNRVRMINTTGFVSTLAGSTLGTSGYVDDTGTYARFSSPEYLTIDSNYSNLYVADTLNQVIRKVSIPNGNTTTLAGTSGVAGYLDGVGTAAQFRNPSGLAIDISGNLLVADTNNYVIRKVTMGGVVTTVAGSRTFAHADGQGLNSSFTYPIAITTDIFGNIYVSDKYPGAIRMINSSYYVLTIAGNTTASAQAGFVAEYVDGPALSAKFKELWGLIIDPFNQFLIITDGNVMRKLSCIGTAQFGSSASTSSVSSGMPLSLPATASTSFLPSVSAVTSIISAAISTSASVASSGMALDVSQSVAVVPTSTSSRLPSSSGYQLASITNSVPATTFGASIFSAIPSTTTINGASTLDANPSPSPSTFIQSRGSSSVASQWSTTRSYTQSAVSASKSNSLNGMIIAAVWTALVM